MGPPLPDLDDDDDDDLDVVVPAPKSKPAAPPIDLDDDDEDLLPPQGSLKMHSLDASKNITPPSVDDLLEDDDDLDLPPPPPPPPAAAAAKAPSVASTKSTPSAPLSKPVDSPSSAATPATSILAAKTSGAASSQQAEGSDAARQGPRAIENPRRKSTTMHVQVGHVTLEGWLEKQNPSWPHAYKRRYCIISGSTLAYYDCPPQPGHDPLGHFSLCGATISLDCDKRPFSFGISGPTLTHKGISGRMYIFAANTKDEMTQWVTAMQTAAANTTSNELHWFEKLVEGIY